MKPKFLLFLFLFAFGLSLQAQDTKETRVLISEKKEGKRITIRAKNTTKDTLNFFFMVQSEGFRRSADRPTIKFINPGETLEVITLIELTDVPSNYEYMLVVNEEDFSKDIHLKKEITDIEKQITNKIVLFTDASCGKCQLLHTELTLNNIDHQVFDINKDIELYRQFTTFVTKKFPGQYAMRLPAVWNKDHLIFGWDQLETIVNKLKE